MFDGFSPRGSGALRLRLVTAVLPAAVLCCAGCEGGGEQTASIRLKGGVQQVGETEGTIVSPDQDPVARKALEFARQMDQSVATRGGDSATGAADQSTQFDGPTGAGAGGGGVVMTPTVSGVRVEESGPVEEVVWLTPDEGDGSGQVVTASLPEVQSPATPRRPAARMPVIDVEPVAEVVIDDPVEVAAAEGAERLGETGLSETETEELVRELRERLMREAGEGDGSLRAYLAAASLSVAEPGGELTESQLAALDVEARRGVLAYQRALAQLGRELGDGSGTGEEAMRMAAEEIVEQMRSERSLRILNPKLCVSVEGYGVYEEFKSTTFLAGVSQRVVIYAELENFAPRVETGGGYEVQLSHEVALHNESDGLVVWRQKPVEITDRSKNRRRDFFVVQLVELPSRLTVGKYRLKLTITDQIGGTVDEASMPIEVVADESLSKAGR